MAPQNSTLIHENFESTSELSRYSPILPLTEEEDDGYNDKFRRKKSICTKTIIVDEEDDEIPIWICGEPRFISGITSTTTCFELIQALIDDELCDNVDNDKASAINKAEKKCYDVAASRDLNDYVITERWRDVEQALTGETHILPIWQAWGNARNEVKLKLKINKNKVGHENSELKKKSKVDNKPKKNKMGMLTKLMRHLVHQTESIHNQLAIISEKSMEKHKTKTNRRCSQRELTKKSKKLLMDKFLDDSLIGCDTMSEEPRSIVEQFATLSDTEPLDQKSDKPSKFLMQSDDELFLLIDDTHSNDDMNDNDDVDSGCHVEYRQYLLNKKLKESIRKKAAKNIVDTPKRKFRDSKLENYTALKHHSLNRRLVTASLDDEKPLFPNNLPELKKSVGRFDNIRYEIAERMLDMNELLQLEEKLIHNLAKRCAQFSAQNDIYRAKIGLEMCIEEVQQNLDLYAKEIVQNEIDLHQLKMEITQKCGILHNLRRMLKIEELERHTMAYWESNEILADDEKYLGGKNLAKDNNVDFVDNIYEFCDNNKSLIV